MAADCARLLPDRPVSVAELALPDPFGGFLAWGDLDHCLPWHR